MSAVLSGRSTDDAPAFPSGVTYDAAMSSRRLQRARALVRRATGKDLYPEPERLRTFAEDMFRTDPVAERFVDEVYCTLGLLLRLPAVTLVETLRRVSPTFRRLHEKVMCRHRENWHRWQSSGRPAEFAHGKGLRR
ncbi:hypothetical protein [Gordonia amicalis]|uniref:hypothetical protein n=1 Tax=Gordonia amicalis TaxID=89053 RepID=UPI0002A63BED|nr:hypothetical protein [Gordonia amicalis]MBA5847842.1 hypothetical protein [Gordonia amicalis]MDV7099937.1 hypothetical protein [Gordonia amicalis]MDV7174245.1 hypothetical protein [Gordonia amicalis]NKX77686.1 ATP-dependent DNA helicase RecQ [Gordonia amicalis]UOG21785.1 hypothetical protein MTX80_01120 [Gordonia amicalis]